MKKLLSVLVVVSIFLSMMVNVMAKGSITCDKQSLTLEVGQKETFTVTADYAAGRVDFKVEDESIATVSSSKEWLDMSSVDIEVEGLKAGKTTIAIVLTDVSDYDGEELTGSIVMELTVKGPERPVVDPEPEDKKSNAGLITTVAATTAVGGVGVYALAKKKKKED